MKRFITGEKFKALANHIFIPGQELKGVEDGDIIYSDIDHVKKLAEAVSVIDEQVILITHNGDASMDIIPPDNVIKWYSQNVGVDHARVESLPIGVENNQWFPEVQKKEKMLNRLMVPKECRGLMYMSHSVATNPVERSKLYDLFEKEPWVTSFRGSNRPNLFDQYLDNIDTHKFVISPRGNGLDTHRTWECLYVESIPIEKRNLNNRFYEDLPICFVDEWEEITEEFLNAEYERITTINWNIEKIDFQYWENKILKE